MDGRIQELDHEVKPDGTIVRTQYGIERIPDPMAMEEMTQYDGEINVDRIVSLAALVAFAKVQQANRGYRKRTEVTDKKYLQKSEKMTKLPSSPFRHVGNQRSKDMINNRPPRNPYKNLR